MPGFEHLTYNGPAVEGVNVGGVSPSGYVSRCFSQKVIPAGKPPWRTFCRPNTNFSEHYECRGTSLIGAANLSPVINLIVGTCAVSRYKPLRSQKFVMVQNYNCGQMRVSGYNGHYQFVLGAGAKQKPRRAYLLYCPR